jgi:hypothetical protein
MMARFKPLELVLIEEGRFAEEIDAAMARLQSAMVLYVKRHGVEKAAKAKAKLQIGVTLMFEGPHAEDFSVKGELRESVPSRPAVVTRAVADEMDTGEPALFVRASGSTSDDPHQGVLTTEDGRPVDTATGEVLEPEQRKIATKKR